ncbi:MAG: diguanylate cyclase [Vitreoscilla sp.]|nr:diguanylate cyclase [Vitreoscilla sp.]
MKLTLKTKAALVSTSLVLGSVSLVGGWLYRQQASDHASLLRDQQNALATALAADMDHKLRSHLGILSRAAFQIDPGLWRDAAAQKRFFELSGLRPPFDGLALVAADGQVVYNDPPDVKLVNIGDRDYFRQARDTGQPAISQPLLSRTRQQPLVLMAVPLFDAEHRFLGVLGGGLSLLSDNVLGGVSRTRVGSTGYVEIQTIGPQPVTVLSPDQRKLLQPAAANPEGDDFDTQSDFVTRQKLQSVPWELRVVIPAQEAHGSLLSAQRTLLMALVVLGVGCVLAVWAGMGWLMRPLENLLHAMRRQRRSPDEIVPIDTSARDERGALAREFDGLMRELRAQRAELAAVTDASPLGLFRAEPDGRVSYVNEAYLRIHGLTREQAPEGWLGMVPAHHLERVRAAWRAAVARLEPFHVQRRLRRPDGQQIKVSMRSAPVVVDGVLVAHVGTVSDITERAEGERALRTLAAIFEATTDFVLQSDAQGNLLYMNPAARRLLGIGLDEPIAHRNALEFNPPATVKRHADEIVPAAVAHGVWVGESLQWDGQHRELLVSHLLIAHKSSRGRVEYFSAVLRDITAQKAAEQALFRSEAILRTVIDTVPAGIVVVDREGRYVLGNRGSEAVMGRPRAEMIGQPADRVLGPEEFALRKPYIVRALAGERVRFEREWPEREHLRHVQIDYIPLFNEQGEVEGFVSVTSDISASRVEERRLRGLAITDPLTQLLNRAGFDQALADRAERAEPGLSAVLYVDLDRFKDVNDQHGHGVGDQLLEIFAKRLRAIVRPTDTVARLGGDEFAIVLGGLQETANALRVADKVVAAAADPFHVRHLVLHIGASVGVACWRPGEPGAQDAVHRADAMLYHAKAAGRGRVAH